MSETNLTNLPYHCPICINDFTDKGVTPFKCQHKLCRDCNKEFRKSKLFYKCPLCKSDIKKNSINKIILAIQQNSSALLNIKNQTYKLCKIAIIHHANALQYIKNQTFTNRYQIIYK
jgi:hypothetical protein